MCKISRLQRGHATKRSAKRRRKTYREREREPEDGRKLHKKCDEATARKKEMMKLIGFNQLWRSSRLLGVS